VTAKPANRRLPVRSCRVIGTGDSIETHHTVQCPRKHEATAFAKCCGCSHMTAIDVDPDGKHGTVECHVDEAPLPNGRVDVAEAAVRIRLGDVLGMDTTCVRSDVKIDTVIELVLESGVRAVPVVDESRRLVGIVSKSDLLRPRGTGKAKTKLVSEIMTPVVHGLPEDAPIAYAISLMAFEGLHEVPIVDSQSHVIGMITATDALRWVAQSLGYVVPGVVTVQPAK
jgi:CBS domain-containing protein